MQLLQTSCKRTYKQLEACFITWNSFSRDTVSVARDVAGWSWTEDMVLIVLIFYCAPATRMSSKIYIRFLSINSKIYGQSAYVQPRPQFNCTARAQQQPEFWAHGANQSRDNFASDCLPRSFWRVLAGLVGFTYLRRYLVSLNDEIRLDYEGIRSAQLPKGTELISVCWVLNSSKLSVRYQDTKSDRMHV